MFRQEYFNFKPSEFHVFVGLDVDKKSISATFITQDRFLRSLTLPYSGSNLICFVRKHFADKKVAFVYEAGPTGYGLYDELTADGYVCLVAAPSMIPRAPGERVKTNRLDSRKLAEVLRSGGIRSVRVPSPWYRQIRHLVRLRECMARRCVSIKLRMKSLLLVEGIKFPGTDRRENWSKAAIEKLQTLSCNPAIRFKLDCFLLDLQFNQKQLSEVTHRMLEFCEQNPESKECVKWMKSIPGIGSVTALYLLSAIGDWRALRNVRELAAFLGLVPREKSTGDKVVRGPITRLGDPVIRGKLIEASWRAIRLDPELKEFYTRIHERNPLYCAGKKAVVAVARKLTARIYSVLVCQRPYRKTQQVVH